MLLRKLLRQALVICVGCMAFTPLAFSQTRTISGEVTDSKDGQPVVGASVIPKGSYRGVSTDAAGKFHITVPSGLRTLVVSSVGYTTREIPAGGDIIIVTLTPSNAALNEVVVVGYGTQRKKEVTGAISKVGAAEITALPTPSLEASLQGRVPGVQVSQSSGLAGAGSYVRIRGIASVSAGGDPLYVVDGIPITSDPLMFEGSAPPGSNSYLVRQGFTQSPLASLNPDDIESIEILKDAGAAGIYGSRGANGVILITTKRGKIGKPQFNFSSKLGFSTPSVKPKLLNNKEWIQLRQEAWENDGHSGPVTLPNGMTMSQALATNTDWWDLLTHTGVSQDYNLSMSYGKKKFKSYVGATYGDNQTYAVGNSFKRYSIRGNFDYTFSPRFKASLLTSYADGINNRVPTGWAGGLGAAMSGALPIYPVYVSDGSYDLSHSNPLFAVKENKFRSLDHRAIGGLALTWTPINNLDLRANGNIDNYRNYQDIFTNNRASKSGDNSLERWWLNTFNYNLNATATYRYNPDVANSFTFLVGTEYQRSTTTNKHYYLKDSTIGGLISGDWNSYNGKPISVNLPNNYPGISKRDSLISDQWSFISYFGRVNYSFRNKLYLQALARIDGSSKFGPDNRYGFFPAASAAYVLSEEDFVKNNLPFLSFLKLRTSYGITGNAAIPSFKYLARWGSDAANTVGAYNGNGVIHLTQVGNHGLRWETANNFDAGIEFGILNGKISGEVAYYNKLTRDVLMNVNLEEGYGIGKSTVYENIGRVKNEGVELSLSAKLVTTKQLTWTVFGNAAHNYNVVEDAGGYSPEAIQSGTNETRVVKGYPLGTSYTIVFKGVDPANGLPIWLDVNNKLTETFPSLDARRAAGKLIPDWVGGFGTNLVYKGFELNALFAYSTGLDIWDNSGKQQFFGVSAGQNWNFRRDFLNRWRQLGDVSQYPRLVYDKLYPGLSLPTDFSSTMFLYKGDYLRLRELTLAYKFSLKPASKIKTLRVFVTAMNLFLWTRYAGGDPEVNRDADGGTTDRNMSPNVTYLTPPQPKTVQVGLNVNF